MNEKDNKKRILTVVRMLAGFGLAFLLMGCGRNARTPDKWLVEIQITEKDTTTRETSENGKEVVYLINCEDAEGAEHIFELTDAALEGKFEAKEAFQELKTGKSYKFRVGWYDPAAEDQPGYYPSIYGAVKMEGLHLENLPNIDEGEENEERRKVIVPGKETDEPLAEGTMVSEENQTSEEGTKVPKENQTLEEGTEMPEENQTLEEGTEMPEENQALEEGTEVPEEKEMEASSEQVEAEEKETIDEDRIKDLEESIAESLKESFEAEKKELEDAIRNLEERMENIER